MRAVSIRVRVYGPLQEHFPTSFTVHLSEAAAVSHLFEALAEEAPQAQALLAVTVAARGERLVERQTPLCDGDEIALLPPASGG